MPLVFRCALFVALAAALVPAQSPRPLWFPNAFAGELLAIDTMGQIQARRAVPMWPRHLVADAAGRMVAVDVFSTRLVLMDGAGQTLVTVPNRVIALSPDGRGGALLLLERPAGRFAIATVDSFGVITQRFEGPGVPVTAGEARADHWVVSLRTPGGSGLLVEFDRTSFLVRSTYASILPAVRLVGTPGGQLLVAGALEDAGLVLNTANGLLPREIITLVGNAVDVQSFFDGTQLWLTHDPDEATWRRPNGTRFPFPLGGPALFERLPEGAVLARAPTLGGAFVLDPGGVRHWMNFTTVFGTTAAAGVDELVRSDAYGDADGDTFGNLDELQRGYDPLAATHAPIAFWQEGRLIHIAARGMPQVAFAVALAAGLDAQSPRMLVTDALFESSFIPGLILDQPFGRADGYGIAEARILPPWQPGVFVAAAVQDPSLPSGLRLLPAAPVQAY